MQRRSSSLSCLLCSVSACSRKGSHRPQRRPGLSRPAHLRPPGRRDSRRRGHAEPGRSRGLASGERHVSVAVQRARDVTIEVDGRKSVCGRRRRPRWGHRRCRLELHPGDRIYADGQLTNERGPLAAALYASAVIPGPGTASPQVQLSVVRSRPVTVMVDSLPVQVSSSAATVEQMLAELGMTVREGDLVRPGLSTPITAGMVVRLAKGRTVTVRLDGKEQSLYTLAANVGDVIRVLNIDPSTHRQRLFAAGSTYVQRYVAGNRSHHRRGGAGAGGDPAARDLRGRSERPRRAGPGR